jgi:hypothetical protein
MPWGVYQPGRKKKPYSLFGYSQVGAKPASRGTGLSANRGVRGFAGSGITPDTLRHGGVVSGTGSGTTTTPGSTDPSYPGFNDFYGDLLSQLASMRDSSLAQLKANMEGRYGADKQLIDASYDPLRQNYNTAIAESQSVNDSVANRLAQQGGSATDALTAKLNQLSAPGAVTAQSADALKGYYGGLSNANYAMDSGDTQRLIGRLSEEEQVLNKMPLQVRQELEAQYGSDAAQVLSDYMQQSFGLKQSQGEARSQYEQDRFNFQQEQKDKAAAKAASDEQLYWDNYYKDQDLRFKRWQTQIASGDKRAADKTRKEIADAKNQSAIDVANIRAGATVTAANTRASATVTAANTRAGAKGSGTNVNQDRAYKAALNAIIDPKTGLIRRGVNPYGYNAELTMQGSINDTLRGLGIDPFSPKGTAIRRSVMRQANNRKFAVAKNAKPFKYDPNWASKLKNKPPKNKKK